MVWIEKLKEHVGKEVTLKGWVYNKRDSGKVRFVLLRDGTGILQCVFVDTEIDIETYGLADSLNQEAVV